jgi:hypothetical protein
MPVNTSQALAERLDVLEARYAALRDAIVCAFGAAGQPPPPSLRDDRPPLRVLDGGRK